MRSLLASLAAASAMAALACGASPPDGDEARDVPEPPFLQPAAATEPAVGGVVMIVVDTLRADHVGAYGSTRGLTPRIDELAEEGFLFERAVAASSWTRPSIAAMLTSRFPTSMGLLDKSDSLPESAATLPEVLQNQAGFQTLAVITNGNIAEEWGFDQGFDRFVWPHLRRRYAGDFPIHVAEGVTGKALELLDGRDPERPFFLFVLYVDPHDPYLPHPELASEPVPAGRFDGSRKQLHALDKLRLGARPADYERIRHLYAGEVQYVDLWIGRLLDGLEERGLADEVLIALTADHGEGLWSHGLRGHGNDLYEESVHVPLLLRYPGTASGEGRRIPTPVSLVDLAPTVLAAAGAPRPPAFQGFDLRPLTRGEDRGSPFAYVYTEMDHRGRNFEAIREGDWKLIRTRGTDRGARFPPVQVFDLASDAEEKHDLSRDARARPRRRLAAALEKWSLAVLGEAVSRQHVALADLDRATLDNLRALGYLGDTAVEPAVRREGESDAPRPRPGVPDASVATIDFASSGPDHPQLIDGFSAGPRSSVWASGTAAVVLDRRARHETWSVGIEIGADAERLPVGIRIVPDGGDPATVEIHSPGLYTLEGPLPEATTDDVVLEIECRHLGAGPEDRNLDDEPVSRRPCVRFSQISLR